MPKTGVLWQPAPRKLCQEFICNLAWTIRRIIFWEMKNTADYVEEHFIKRYVLLYGLEKRHASDLKVQELNKMGTLTVIWFKRMFS